MALPILKTGFFAWCMDMLRQLEAARTPFMNSVMSVLTELGQEMAFIVIGLIFFWCVNKKFGYRFMFMYLMGAAVNQIIKAVCMIPRPWVIDKELTIVESARDGASGFSFPSGHAQSSVLLYGGIASYFKGRTSRILAAVAAVIALIVGFSRMYLGVHTFLDVAVSFVTGVIILLILMRKNSRFGEDGWSYPIAVAAVGIAVIGMIIYINKVCAAADLSAFYTAAEQKELINSGLKDAWTLYGSVLGLLLGCFVESRCIKFDPRAAWWVQIIKVVIGLSVIIGLRVGLKKALELISDSVALNAVRYGIITFTAIGLLPFLFKPLSKLGRKKEEAAE